MGIHPISSAGRGDSAVLRGKPCGASRYRGCDGKPTLLWLDLQVTLAFCGHAESAAVGAGEGFRVVEAARGADACDTDLRVAESIARAVKASISPNEAAIVRLVGVMLLKQNDEWAAARSRYLSLEKLAQISDDPQARPHRIAAV